MPFLINPQLDGSGNGNNWTANNIDWTTDTATTYDIMSDVPTLTDEDTSNFAVMNPLDNALSVTITNGNLQIASSSASWKTARSTFVMPAGSWYCEFTATTGIGTGNSFIGIVPTGVALPQPIGEGSATSWGYGSNGSIYNNGSIINATGLSWSSGDVVAMTFNGSTLVFYKNNSLVATVSSIPSNDYCVGFSLYSTDAGAVNFGQRPFEYTPPSGFKKLNTFNLPDSTIVKGSEHFNTVTYTGSASDVTVTTNFYPDLTWAKSRNNTYNPSLIDSNRGGDDVLFSNLTSAESTVSGLATFSSTGVTYLAGEGGVNADASTTYVLWAWKAGAGTAVSNTDGSITSTVSANTTAGFSVISYTEPSGSFTIGHGLGVAPTCFFMKNRVVGGENWIFWSEAIAAVPTNNGLYLNSTSAKFATGGNWLDSISSTTIGYTNNKVSQAGSSVMYAFAEVEGYSKFGSYVGNGSTDGPFIYTGFRPAYLMFKCTDNISHWTMVDNKRNTYNVMDDSLYADTSAAEHTTITDVDFLSNGFKWRGVLANETNVNNFNYIYMAFAENPFKNSLAR